MKKIFGIISALLILVCFTHEAKSYTVNDGNGIVISDVSSTDAPMVVALNPTAIDNVVVISSVENVVASVTSYIEVGGSIVSSDANLPDQDNIVAISNSKVSYGLWLLSKRKYKTYIASNELVKNDKVGEIPSNVGKYSASSRIT